MAQLFQTYFTICLHWESGLLSLSKLFSHLYHGKRFPQLSKGLFSFSASYSVRHLCQLMNFPRLHGSLHLHWVSFHPYLITSHSPNFVLNRVTSIGECLHIVSGLGVQ